MFATSKSLLLRAAVLVIISTTAGRVFSEDAPPKAATPKSVEANEIASDFRAAKTAAETEILAARNDLLEYLEGQMEIAKSKKGDIKLHDTILAEYEAFRLTGEVLISDASPRTKKAQQYHRAQRNAYRDQLKAYERCIERYTKSDLLDEARLLQAETDKLRILIQQPELRPFIDREFLLNPSCEQYVPKGKIPHWEIVSGTWFQCSSNKIKAAAGDFYFHSGKGRRNEIVQTISLKGVEKAIDSSKLVFSYRGKVRSYPQKNPDRAEVVVEFVDRESGETTGVFSSGKIAETKKWREVTVSAGVPAKSGTVKVRLISHRSSGQNNDGYHDAASLVFSLK